MKKILQTHITKQAVLLLIVVLGVATIGVGLQLASHAATPTAAIEPEDGVLSSSVTAGDDAQASGGKFIKFGTPAGGGTFATSYVTRNGNKFMLAGKEFRFIGFNLFDAASVSGSRPSSCQSSWSTWSSTELDNTFKYMHDQAGATVVRVWAYDTYTNNGTNWAGLDQVFSLAQKNGLKVLPVLEDGPGYCSSGPAGQAKWQYSGDTWYTAGYKVPYGSATLSYRNYIQLVVNRYKNDPTILGWAMMNEATTSAKDGNGGTVLRNFANDIGPLIKSLDSNHLVTLGTESDGYSGATGSDFAYAYNLPSIDFTEAHDYANPTGPRPSDGGFYDPLPLTGLTNNGTGSLPDPNSTACQAQYGAPIACAVASSLQIINKPIVIGEAAIPTSISGGLTGRSNLFQQKFNVAFTNGVSGYLVWQFNKVYDSGAGNLDVIQSANDPVIGVMKQQAQALNTADGTAW